MAVQTTGLHFAEQSQFYYCVNRFGLWSHSHLCWPTRQYNNWI